MSKHFAVIQQKTAAANQAVSKQVSQYTGGLRVKMRKITDIEQEFNQVYGNFVDAKLPKDDLYWQIK